MNAVHPGFAGGYFTDAIGRVMHKFWAVFRSTQGKGQPHHICGLTKDVDTSMVRNLCKYQPVTQQL